MPRLNPSKGWRIDTLYRGSHLEGRGRFTQIVWRVTWMLHRMLTQVETVDKAVVLPSWHLMQLLPEVLLKSYESNRKVFEPAFFYLKLQGVFGTPILDFVFRHTKLTKCYFHSRTLEVLKFDLPKEQYHAISATTYPCS